MKEDMFEVLMYLFENHMKSNCQMYLAEELLLKELESVGFNPFIVDSALDWLDGLLIAQENTLLSCATDSFRLFSSYEAHKLSAAVQGFLLSLQQKGILNSLTRELVIDRLLAIESQEIELAQVKWVTLLVLFNQPDEQAALACLENIILENSDELH